MNLLKIKDNIENGICRVYHSTNTQDLGDIIVRGDFSSGNGGGSMIGSGFYANLQLFQAQKNNYGKFILVAELVHLKDFWILEFDSFKRIYGDVSGVDESNFRMWQLQNHFGFKPFNVYVSRIVKNTVNLTESVDFDKLSTTYPKYADSSAALARDYYKGIRSNCIKKPIGIIYKGNRDGLSLVCWYPELYVKPISVSIDNGKTFESIDSSSIQDLFGKVASNETKSFSSKDEELRSIQRADDLKMHLKKEYWSLGDKIRNQTKSIASQLVRIKDPAKYEIRKNAMLRVFCAGEDENYKKSFADRLDEWIEKFKSASILEK